MAVIIAGRVVKPGDSLYHTGYGAFGVVSAIDTNTARVKFTGANGSTREVFVATGGIVGGRRQVFWHEPLHLDLPSADIGRFQRLVNALVAEGL